MSLICYTDACIKSEEKHHKINTRNTCTVIELTKEYPTQLWWKNQ